MRGLRGRGGEGGGAPETKSDLDSNRSDFFIILLNMGLVLDLAKGGVL